MCGIIGYIGFDGKPISSKVFQELNSLQRHRGPDDEGYLFFNADQRHTQPAAGRETMPNWKAQLPDADECSNFTSALGFRRLAIVDLSFRGHQPMTEASRRYWIVFNGEIYNHNELRFELQQKGFAFATESDTEVILNAFRYWGKECVSRFNGMWAFAILDSLNGSLFLSRDRFGVKPLYFNYQPGKHLVFASEMKPLLAAFGGNVNESVIGDFLYNGLSDHTHSTFWKNIQQLPQGCSAHLEKGELKIESYYQLSNDTYSGSFTNACNTFSSLLADAVRLRQRSDVQLGFALSGGLDSSSLLGLSRKVLPYDHVVSYSLVFPGDAEDESRYIDAVNAFNDLQYRKFSFQPNDLLQDLDAFCLSQEQPFGGLSYYGEFKLKECMHRAGVVVSIEGQGADEIISGYTNLLPYYFADLLAEGKWFQFMKRSAQHKSTLSNPLKSALKLLLDRCVGSVRLHDPAKYASFDAEYYPVNNTLKIAEGGRGYLNAELRQQLSHTSLPEQLIKADKSAMHFSIESRFPFLDYRLVDFAATLPYSYKIHDKSKYILREALRDVLPPMVYERRDKIGFAVPVHKMVSDELFKNLTQHILDSKFPGFDASRFFNEFSSKEQINWRYWKVVSLILWNQSFDSFKANRKLDLTN